MSTQDGEAFLSRWSRRKVEERAKEEAPPPAAVVETAEEEAAPPLQPVEELTHDSDFKQYMHAKVPANTRREALKKLFTDPQFNVPDPFEPFSGDWTVEDPIPLEMLKTLNQAKTILFNEPQGGAKDAPPDEAPAEVQSTEVPKEEDGSGSEKPA
jgi:hypothetical protein